jgi:sigma-B regulation protein RsbU (phosphoserine phosphatase)
VADYSYPLETVKLVQGDCLILVTDGVTEAENSQGEFFGRDRILAGGLTGADSATAIVDAIRDRVREFEAGTEATDDLTAMAIRYLGPGA